MDLDSEEDYHKYITALWFWSMNLTSKVFIIWNSYTKHKKQKRLKEALNKSQNSLNWIDDLKSSQEFFKNNDFFQTDLFLLAGSFTESAHYDLFKPLSESSSDSDKDKSDNEDNTGRHSSNKKHESPVTTCMSENFETSLDGLFLKDAEAKVFLTGGENDTASDKEVGGQEDKTCEDSGRNYGSGEGAAEEHEEDDVNLIVDVVGNKHEDDCFRLQQDDDDEDDDTVADDGDGNYDNDVNENCDNHPHDSNFGDDIDKEQEVANEDCDIDDDDNNKSSVTDIVNNHDEDNKHDGNNDSNDESGCCNTDDDDNDGDDDNNKDGAGDSDEIDISSNDKVKLLSEENAKAIPPVIGEFKGATSFKTDQRWLNKNHLSVLIELNRPERQVHMKSNVNSNTSVEDNVSYMQDISTQTETVAGEILQTSFLLPEKSFSKFTTMSHPFTTKNIYYSESDSKQLIPPDAFHVTEKDMHPFDADSNDETSCNVKAFEKKLYFHPIVAKPLEHVTKDVHKTMHARFHSDPNSLQFASQLPPCDEINVSRYEAGVRQCCSKPFQKTSQGTEIKRYPKIVKWIDDEVGCKNIGNIPFFKSTEVSRIPLLAEPFHLQNNSEDISSQMQVNERSLSGENIYPPNDIVSRLCSIFNKTRSTCSDQSFAEILCQSNILDSVEKPHLQQGTLERNTSSRDLEIRKTKLDLEHANDECLEELEQIRKRLKDFQELKSKLERSLETQEQLVEIMNDKTLSGSDMHNSLNIRSLLENLKKEIATLTSRYYREESRCILIAKRAKHLLNEMNI